jgi:ribonuclease HIII
MAERSSYTCRVEPDKIPQLKGDLEEKGYSFRTVPHAHFGAASDVEKVNVAMYRSGKLVIQGKGTTDFVQFYLEPCLLGEARLGYEHILDPTMLAERIGVDESGKGDYFGPLVVAGVYLDQAAAEKMIEIGVRDSKRISSDKRIDTLAREIRKASRWNVVPIGPAAYNRLHARMRNTNEILGWGHARVIENLLELQPDCPRAVADQFGNQRIIERALMGRGKKIKLEQRHRAESDLAVAAASILARDEFVRRLRKLGTEFNVELPKGASAAVEQAAVELVRQHGPASLEKVAKTHFRTTQKILAETA